MNNVFSLCMYVVQILKGPNMNEYFYIWVQDARNMKNMTKDYHKLSEWPLRDEIA